MKKVLLATLMFVGIAATSFAQDGGKFSIGVEAGLPLGSASDVSSVAIGGSLKYDLPIAEKTAFTASAGYTRFFYKSDVKNALKSIGIDRSGEGFVPVKVGIKYELADALYAEGQIGATFITSSDADKKVAFAYAPGIGYKFSDAIDLGVRYEGWSVSGGTTSQIAARLAYSF
jgi:hypothetical protein